MKTSKNILELLIQTLTTYLAQLSSEILNQISENIMNKYLNNKTNIQKNILYKMPLLYSKKQLKNLKVYFLKWKKLIRKNNSFFYNFNNSNISYHNSSNSSFYIPPFDLINNLDFNNQYSLRMSNENSSKIKSTFIKSLNQSPEIINQMNPSLDNNPNVNLFLKRQEIYKNEHDKSQKKIFDNYEEENNILHPFIPKINNLNKKSTNKTPAHLRLFNDSIERQNRQNKLEKKYYNNSSNNKHISEEKIEKLYKDYKVRKVKNDILKKKLDLERGYTFIPEINHKKIKNLNRSFGGNESKKTNNINCKSSSVNISFENELKDTHFPNTKNNKAMKNTYNNKKNKNFNFIFDYIRDKTIKQIKSSK